MKSNFYMISDDPNVSLGIVNCSFYTRRIPPKVASQETKVYACIFSREVQLLGTSCKDFHDSCLAKPVQP